MNWKSVILITMVGFVASCNKFEHETFILPNCELCGYAETLEGTYRGLSYGIAVPDFSDSITITVEQVFLGNSQYEDSTFMRFKVYYDFDSSFDVEIHNITLLNSSGNCEANMSSVLGTSNQSSHPENYYEFASDSLKISYYSNTGPTTFGSFFHGNFAKQ